MSLDAAERKTGIFEIALGIIVDTREGSDIANRVDDDTVDPKSKYAGTQDNHNVRAIAYIVDLLCGQSSWRFWWGRSLGDINGIAEAFHAR